MLPTVDRTYHHQKQDKDAHILVKNEQGILNRPIQTVLHHHKARKDHGKNKDRHTPMKQTRRTSVFEFGVRHSISPVTH
jgi:hypothetical protein